MGALGKGQEARSYFTDSLEIARRLAEAEPDRADYQRDLSVTYNKLGDLMRALGRGEEARSLFTRALEIAQRLAETGPTTSATSRSPTRNLGALSGMRVTTRAPFDTCGRTWRSRGGSSTSSRPAPRLPSTWRCRWHRRGHSRTIPPASLTRLCPSSGALRLRGGSRHRAPDYSSS